MLTCFKFVSSQISNPVPGARASFGLGKVKKRKDNYENQTVHTEPDFVSF